VITDAFTARVLGSICLVMTLIVDVSCFIFTKPEISHRPTFPLVVILPSLPIIAFGVYLFRKASHLKTEDE
jgi:lipopolysaccharide export LptBFGC system permease protein LptF